MNTIEKIDSLQTFIVQHLTTEVELKEEVRNAQAITQETLIDFCVGIVEILDNIEIKNKNLTRRYGDEETGRKILKSYHSISKQLLSLLANYGVTRLTYPDNRLITGYCRVVDTEPNAELPNDTIIAILREGYIRGSELIREAEVTVVKN
jgi:molecular chaperone GrpE (heat shock protein)